MEVLVVSKSFIVREALGLFFNNIFDDHKIRGLKDLKDVQNLNLSKIDFVFIDLGQDSKESVRCIKELFRDAKIMIFNKNRKKEIFIDCIKNGISSYLVDIPEKDELMYIVKTVIKGKKYYDIDLLEDVFNVQKENDVENIELLTDRENEVLDRVSMGLTNKEIAKELYVSEHTIKKHVTSILSKLDMRNRRDLIIYKKYRRNNIALNNII